VGKTAIGWTDETWNPVRGCSRVSEGCRHCYAEQQAARIVRMGKGKPTPYDGLVKLVNGEPRWTGVVRLVPERLADPLRWRQPRRVFVNSMSDLFHESLTNEQIAAVFGVMAACPRHTFQVLTKRARRMREWFEWIARGDDDSPNDSEDIAYYLDDATCDAIAGNFDCCHLGLTGRKMPWPLPNVWLGVSVENQGAADERIPELLDTPAVVRFLSCEPLLGDVSLFAFLNGALRNECLEKLGGSRRTPGIDWLIDGCESGKEARPALPEWFASLEEQCRVAGVAYFHKQEIIDGKLVHDFPGRQEFPR
jgi:protein gp37